MTTGDRSMFADGMACVARVCAADHDELATAAAERGALRALLAVLGLLLAAAWMRR